MPKRKNNITATTAKGLTTNRHNLNKKFNLMLILMLRYPFRFLTFLLASSAVLIFGNKTRNFFGQEQPQNQLIPSEPDVKAFVSTKNQFIPCGSNFEEFVPKSSACYTMVKMMVNKDCEGLGNISPSFAQINGYAYAAGCCEFINMPLEKCSNMPGRISSLKSAKQIALPKNLVGLTFVEEGKYAIADVKQTIATIGISFCVGVAITNSTKVLLAHVNADNNILAHDHYLKGKFEDPFIAIKDFIANSNLDGWKVTLVSGQIENIVHIKTVLENMGLNNIDSYYESDWSESFSKEKVNMGTIMIKEGQTFIIKNPQDFKHLFATISADQKDKPAALKLQGKLASLKLR